MPDVPQNVSKNNLVRARIVARHWNRDPKCTHLEKSVEYYQEKVENFLKVHENTYAIYEAVLIVEKSSLGRIFKLLCPCCKKTENVTDLDCW